MEEFDFNPDITVLFPEKPPCKAYMDISLRVTPWPIGYDTWFLTLSMLRLLLSEAQRCKDIRKSLKPCHVGMHWKAFAEYSQMSTNLSGFPSLFSFFLDHFLLTKLATSTIRVTRKFAGARLCWIPTSRLA